MPAKWFNSASRGQQSVAWKTISASIRDCLSSSIGAWSVGAELLYDETRALQSYPVLASKHEQFIWLPGSGFFVCHGESYARA
jgi:hypothetical protein